MTPTHFLGLEQSMLSPGVWLIEGRHVRQVMRGGRLWHWEIHYFDEKVVTRRTLNEARYYIREQIFG